MLLSFSVENYLSFKEKAQICFIANHTDQTLLQNTFSKPLPAMDKDIMATRSAILFGANASGKTNFLNAIITFRNLIAESDWHLSHKKYQTILNRSHFLLDKKNGSLPTEFEMQMLINDNIYRYGFSLLHKTIHNEWLFLAKKEEKEQIIFTRIFNEKNKEHTYKFGDDEPKLAYIANELDFIRKDRLLLSVASNFNINIAKKIAEFILGIKIIDIKVNSAIFDNFDETQVKLFELLLSFADVGIHKLLFSKAYTPKHRLVDELIRSKEAPEELKERLKELKKNVANQKKLQFVFKDKEGNDVQIPSGGQSKGTLRLFNLFYNILKDYQTNTVLLCDEIESSLHPLLCEAFFDIFHNLPGNNAQLVCSTHNVSLLNQDMFREDQIYITEKDLKGKSSIFSLDEFRDLKEGEKEAEESKNYNKHYLDGRYGGLPILSKRKRDTFLKEVSKTLTPTNE